MVNFTYSKIYEIVRDAMSGNGVHKVNHRIRYWKNELRCKHNYTNVDFYDLTNDITAWIMTGKGLHNQQDENGKPPIQRYDETKGSLQNFINAIVASEVRYRKIKLDNVIEPAVISQYDMDIDRLELDHLEANGVSVQQPDNTYELKELIDIIRSFLTGIDWLVLVGQITVEQAALKLKVRKSTYHRHYQERQNKLRSFLLENGYAKPVSGKNNYIFLLNQSRCLL